MKLILKDRMLTSIKKVVKDCNRMDGFPDHLSVSLQEARWILLEVHKLKTYYPDTKSLSSISFTKPKVTEDGVVVLSPEFFFKNKDRPSEDVIKIFLDNWYNGKYEAIFRYLDYEFPILIKWEEKKETSST